MSDIAGLLKSEIVRLSKKVVREYLAPLQTATTQHRRQLAALKQQVTQLERELGKVRRTSKPGSSAAAAAEPAEGTKIRFVAKGFASMRARLGLSAHDLGLLLGVTTQTIYNWEGKKSTPRLEQVAAIAKLRGVGKKEVRERLAQIEASSK
jgi:DNA-binding XRE family transcriptional regulator